MSAIVNFVRTAPLVIQLDEMDGPKAVAIISREIVLWMHDDPKSNTIKSLAKRANLTPTTVSKILHRETFFPRMLTCILLLKSLGFAAMKLERNNISD